MSRFSEVSLRARHQGARVARRLARTSVGRRVRPPAISVIVPFYNVESYLAACLDSILGQDFSDLEVLLVDDGSPDGSRQIAERYVARDRRVRLLTRPNGGLGAARNTGVRAARGRHLTFVDSDDLLAPGALRRMHQSARRTGSDIVVGAVERFNEANAWSPVWVPEVHDDLRSAITLDQFTPVLRNLYTWDKLYRRDFWRAQDLWFREGVAYEDQPIVTQLLGRARSIDVIPDVVYRYRAREDQSSISQQTATLPDLRDRIEAWRVSNDVLRRELSEEVFEAWRLTLFDVHFHWYLTSAGTVDDTYWAELVGALRELTAGAPSWVWDRTEPGNRVLLTLALLGRRADAQELVRQGRRRDLWPARVRPDGLLLELPLLGDADLDESLFLVRPEQLQLWHSVENFHWETTPDGGAAARISGWAYLGGIDLEHHDSRIAIVLRRDAADGSDGEEHVFWSHERPEPSFPAPLEDRWADYRPGVFGVTVPVSAVVDEAGHGTSWTVELRVEAAGFTVTAPIRRMLRSGAAGVVRALQLPEGGRLLPEWQYNRVLRLRVDRLAVVATGTRIDGRVVSGRISADAGVRSIALFERFERARARVGADGRFRVELPAIEPPAPGGSHEWWLVAHRSDGRTAVVVPDDDAFAFPKDVALAVDIRRDGALIVREFTAAARADSVEVSPDGVMRVRGRVVGRPVREVALTATSKRSTTTGPGAPVVDGRFDATVELRHEVYRFGRWPLPLGDHDVTAELTMADGSACRVPVHVSRRLNDQLPVAAHADRLEGSVVRGPQGGIRLVLRRPIGAARGAFQQSALRRSAGGGRALTRGLLLRSYFGELATDNGVSIQRELQRRGSDLPVYWSVHDHSVVVPEGGIPVVVNSAEWYELLNSAQYYVDNMYQPEFHQKPEGQVLVQTFHGYPFKQMGHPHWRNVQFSQARIDSYDARARQWDYLLSPARYATSLLTRDFAYDGPVLEIGYPRNDVLTSPEADRIRKEARKALGIAEHQTAVLYAPTFRDYLAINDNRAHLADFLDLDKAQRALGDDYVLLIRGHAFNARTELRKGRARGWIDVTDYPEVSDLYLAADVGVVDYSSLRFDFGVTGKPMIFLVPDLQRYKDTRGWLFDFEPTAPGPLVSTTDEVVACLRDLDAMSAQYAAAYDAFRRDYLDLDDGRAAARFVDAVIVPRGDAPPDDRPTEPPRGSGTG